MAWHSAGTYRTGRRPRRRGPGTQRFAPLNSWPDNGNLDKARRLLWPIKQKYGNKLSWADLMILAGNVAPSSRWASRPSASAAAAPTSGSPKRTSTGAPRTEWLGDKRYSGRPRSGEPAGAVQMGLIYVNPEGPNGKPDPLASAATSARPSPAWR
jgi:catalase-peroxidase